MSSLTNDITGYQPSKSLSTENSEIDICFPATSDARDTIAIVRFFQDWLIETATGDLKQFFKTLATALSKVFEAQLITIWDHNKYGNCLVLQASLPERGSVLALHTIPVDTSSTGLVIEKRDFVYYPEILQPGSGRHFVNPTIIRELGLASMISAPVFTPANPQQVSHVINICFDSAHPAKSPISKVDTGRLLSRLGMALQYQIYKRDKEINEKVRLHAASAKAIQSLFDGISDSLQESTQSRYASLFIWNEKKKGLEIQGTTDPDSRTKITAGTTYATEVLATCIEKGQPLVIRLNTVFDQQITGEVTSTVQCPFMAVPILSATGNVIAVLSCRAPLGAGRKAPSFSFLDLQALQAFASAMSPSIERFLRLRQESGTMRIIRDLSLSMTQAHNLKTVLQRTIETLTELLNSEVGSIYLREDETEIFKIRAAKGSNEKLIGEGASYTVGEGITGTIAEGQVLNFKSFAEMRSHPKYRGKYDEQIWGPNADREKETFLGIPITIGDKVIGVWKLANISATPEHPDPYYTDEDVQLAQITSSLIAYAIENYRHEERLVKKFTELALTSIRIQRAPDEDEAIRVVMKALEEAMFAGALLSLYDPQTRELVGRRIFGNTWKMNSRSKCNISDDDIRAVVLRTGREEFVRDSSQDLRCKNNPLDGSLKAQYVFPLRLGDELLGTLQIEMGKRLPPGNYEQLILKAFASHLAIALSRQRIIQQTLELTNQVLASSRFITAEALSAMAVHSLHHKLVHITNDLQVNLMRREVRENRLLNEILNDWKTRLGELETDLENALLFIRAPRDESYVAKVDLHPEIQKAISTWINYLYNNKCTIRTVLNADKSVCRMPAEAFREIISVLLVNAVQAHAKHIEIKTVNNSNIKSSSGKVFKSAFCLECSDDGIGIGTQEYEKIFEATYTTKPKTFGTGLGLFIARRLARDGGGELEVVKKSQQTKGATFRLSLPVHEERK
jgi:GAF domain-containing protein